MSRPDDPSKESQPSNEESFASPKPRKGLSLGALADLVNGDLQGEASLLILSVNGLDDARSDEMTFLAENKFLPKAETSEAGGFLVDEGFPPDRLEGRNLVRVRNVREAFNKIVLELYPPTRPLPGVHPDSSVEETANVDSEATVEARVRIGAETSIGKGTVVMYGAYLGRRVRVGRECVIHPNSVIYDDTLVGDRCVIGAGTVIGQEGFGFYQNDRGDFCRLNHAGRVVIEDEVEIGGCCAIDRGTYGETRIGEKTKIDNLVHIAHNVSVGARNLIMAQVGIAGSGSTDKDCFMLGQSGLSQGVKMHAKTILRPKSSMFKDNPTGGIWSGERALPLKEYNRRMVALASVATLKKELKTCRQEIGILKKALDEKTPTPSLRD